MSRVKLDLPAQFAFTCHLPVRITDLNYGGHVGNDRILSLVHEARMQYLAQFGWTELQFAGASLIMADAAIEFKAELFYGDTLRVHVTPANLSRISFDLFYLLEKQSGDSWTTVARVKTGMVCFDYRQKKVISLPDKALNILNAPIPNSQT